MRTIYPPTQQRSASECAEALEPAFAQLMERAKFAGWTANEVLRGVCVLTWRFAEEPAVLEEAGFDRRGAGIASA